MVLLPDCGCCPPPPGPPLPPDNVCCNVSLGKFFRYIEGRVRVTKSRSMTGRYQCTGVNIASNPSCPTSIISAPCYGQLCSAQPYAWLAYGPAFPLTFTTKAIYATTQRCSVTAFADDLDPYPLWCGYDIPPYNTGAYPIIAQVSIQGCQLYYVDEHLLPCVSLSSRVDFTWSLVSSTQKLSGLFSQTKYVHFFAPNHAGSVAGSNSHTTVESFSASEPAPPYAGAQYNGHVREDVEIEFL